MKKLLQRILVLAVSLSFSGIHAQTYTDEVLFETPTDKIIIDPSPDNVWVIATADKAFLNTGHMGPNSIVTDSINPYPINNNSSFIFVIRNPYTQGCSTTLEFWHKYDIDSLDYGEIEASYDGGNSWVPVTDTGGIEPYWSFFWWDMDYHETTQSTSYHNLKITGTSDGWIKSKFFWQWWVGVDRDTIIANPDSLMIRFSFHSDSNFDNKEGWMIDQLRVEAEYYWGCGSAKNYALEGNMDITPNPFSQNASLLIKKPMIDATLTIYNSFGQAIITKSHLSGNNINFDRGNLKAGIYIVRIADSGQLLASKRIIIVD